MFANNKGKLLFILIAGVLIIALLAGIGVFVLKGKGHSKKGHGKKEEPTQPLALGEFVVNLADRDELRYLKTSIVLAVTGKVPSAGGHGGETGPSPAVRDAVITVLSSKRFADLITPQGKQKLKKELVAAVNERLHECKAVDVYFSDFAMQ
ncbi:MAG: flagellar basal body-associated FliL family protein [Armatimonadota bacterium]|nr:flagellar basal body-associated FliL family protein [Armatimonadota bacterium]